MQLKRKCQGSLCGTWLPGGSSYLFYFKSQPLLHFDGIWGNLFRLKSYIPSSTLAFVDHNKIMFIFLIVGFLFERNKYTAHLICVFISSSRFVREERLGTVQEFGSIAKGWKMNGVSFLIKVAMNRENFWLTGIYLPKFCHCCLPSHTSTCMFGEVDSLAVWVDGEERSLPSPDTKLAWLSLHLLDMTPWWVKDKLAWGPASQPLPAFSLGHISGVNGFQGQTWLSLLNILEATSVGRC